MRIAKAAKAHLACPVLHICLRFHSADWFLPILVPVTFDLSGQDEMENGNSLPIGNSELMLRTGTRTGPASAVTRR
jgi:hypothetical protein